MTTNPSEFDMSPSSSEIATAGASLGGLRGSLARFRPLLPLLLTGIVLIPFGIWWARSEIAAWCDAAAQEADLAEDIEGSLHWIERGLEWNTGDAHLRDFRFAQLMRLGRLDEAIQEADVTLRMMRTNLSGNASRAPREALSAALNNSAYARALAKQELPLARKQIEEALELWQGSLSPDTSLIDTRGYIAYLQGDNKQALEDLEKAAADFEYTSVQVREQMRAAAPLLVDQRGYGRALKRLDYALAVMVHHRGLIYQQVGRLEEAERNLARSTELGYDPAKGIW